MMLQYADFMFQIGMLDESQRDFFQSYAKIAVEHIQNKEFRQAFEVWFSFENVIVTSNIVNLCWVIVQIAICLKRLDKKSNCSNRKNISLMFLQTP